MTAIARFDLVLPISRNEVVTQVLRDEQLDRMIYKTRTLEMDSIILNDVKMQVGKFDMDIKLPFPLNTFRKYLFSSVSWYDQKEDCVYYINKPFVPIEIQNKDVNIKHKYKVRLQKDKEQEGERECYSFNSFQLIMFKQLSDEQMFMRQIHIT